MVFKNESHFSSEMKKIVFIFIILQATKNIINWPRDYGHSFKSLKCDFFKFFLELFLSTYFLTSASSQHHCLPGELSRPHLSVQPHSELLMLFVETTN